MSEQNTTAPSKARILAHLRKWCREKIRQEVAAVRWLMATESLAAAAM